MQFHPEVTAEMHEDWVQRWGDELPDHGLTADGLRADRARYSDDMQRASRALLGEYLDGLALADSRVQSADVSAR